MVKRNLNSRRHGTVGRIALLCLLPILLQCTTLLLLQYLPTTSAIEATFTPNPQDSIENGGDGGPLPVSMQQRRQLLELEAAIVNSQDPSGTIQHVAQKNGMSPEELAGMLERNRRDLQESGQLEGMIGEVNAAMQAQGGGGGGRRSMAHATLPRRILSLVVSIIMTLFKTASLQISRHPRQSSLLAMLLAGTLLAVHNAPKNGIVISSSLPFSRGHTTLLEPPMHYLERYSVNSWERGGWISSLPEPVEVITTQSTKKPSSKSNKKKHKVVVGGVGMTQSLELDTLNAEEEEVAVQTSRSKEDGFVLVTTAQTLVIMDNDIVKDGDENDDDDEALLEARECMRQSITSIFQERKFSEFIPGKNSHSLKFRSFLVASEEDVDVDDDEDAFTEGGVIAMKLLGDFGRYGVQPLCISYETEDEAEDDYDDEPLVHCVAFHTLTGGHFDGELRFLVEETTNDLGVAISVTLAIPSGGRAPPVRLAESMVSSLTQSIAQSSQIRMKQTLSRRRQSRSYRAQASGRATLRRHLRFEQEKLQEEMAADRKRKWKRNNPDAGHYRPSGHRLRSPGGHPSH